MPRDLRVPRLVDLGARLLLALPFLGDGLLKLVRSERSIETLSGAGLAFPTFLNYTSAAIEIVGGAALILGVGVWTAACVLILYLVPATFVLKIVPGREQQTWELDAVRDLGLAGGLLLLAAVRRPRRRCSGGPSGRPASGELAREDPSHPPSSKR